MIWHHAANKRLPCFVLYYHFLNYSFQKKKSSFFYPKFFLRKGVVLYPGSSSIWINTVLLHQCDCVTLQYSPKTSVWSVWPQSPLFLILRCFCISFLKVRVLVEHATSTWKVFQIEAGAFLLWGHSADPDLPMVLNYTLWCNLGHGCLWSHKRHHQPSDLALMCVDIVHTVPRTPLSSTRANVKPFQQLLSCLSRLFALQSADP